jgi:hypothetical protein
MRRLMQMPRRRVVVVGNLCSGGTDTLERKSQEIGPRFWEEVTRPDACRADKTSNRRDDFALTERAVNVPSVTRLTLHEPK